MNFVNRFPETAEQQLQHRQRSRLNQQLDSLINPQSFDNFNDAPVYALPSVDDRPFASSQLLPTTDQVFEEETPSNVFSLSSDAIPEQENRSSPVQAELNSAVPLPPQLLLDGQNNDNSDKKQNTFMTFLKNNVLKVPATVDEVHKCVVEAEQKYLVRVVKYMLKENVFCGNMFEDLDYDACTVKDIKHMLSFMLRSSRVEEADALSKSTLRVTYTTFSKLLETLKQRLPLCRTLIDAMMHIVRDSYDRTKVTDYKMSSLVQFVTEEERDGGSSALEQTSMMSDFFKGMFFPGMVGILGELADRMMDVVFSRATSLEKRPNVEEND